ncbi:MAG: mechanosensitive ion channel family protein [Rhizobiaceae bacterium]|nr:mechanosensitive ion channel family protein [Rhizobiaceae bacterium]
MRPLKHRLRFLFLLMAGLTAVAMLSPLTGREALAQDQQQTQPAAQSGAQQPAVQQQSTDEQSPQLANGLLDAAVTDLNTAKKAFILIQDGSKDDAADDNALVALTGRAEDLSRTVTAISARLKPRFTEIDARLTQLGAPPKEGQPPEAKIVSEERDRLTAERSQVSVVSGDADNFLAEINRLMMQLVEKRRTLFAETLFKRTQVSATTFEDAASAFVQEGIGFSASVTSWIGFVLKAKLASFLTAVFLSLAVGLLLLSGGYRLFGRYYVRDENVDNPPYISRLSVAFWSTLIRTLSLVACLVTSFLFLSNFNVLRPDIAPVLAAFFGFIGLVYFVARLTNAVFAPSRPNWRLVKLSNKGARSLSLCMQAMAVVNGLDYVFDRISESMGSPVVVTVAKSFFAALTIGLILIAASFGSPILAKNGDPNAPGRRWPHGMAIILRVIGVLVIFTAVIGYVGLARFIATQLIVTSAVLVTMYLGVQLGKVVSQQGVFAETIIGRFLENRFKLRDVALDQAGLCAGLATYAVAFLTGIPLILLSWGFHIQDLELIAYRLFTEIRIGNISISLIGIFVGILLFAGGYLVTRWFQRWLDNNVMARGQVDLGVRNSVKTGIGYLGVALAAIFGISAAGIDLSSLALVASALSVGIGFGLQNIVSNFVSGLILLVERPFKVGDWIVSGTSEGIVKRISVRATEIETFRKQSIIVPNSDLINASVGNWTHRNRLARSEIPVSVSFESDPQKVMDILLELVRAIPKVLRNPEPHVEFLRFGPSSLDFEMRFYLSDLSDGMEIRNNLRIAILKRFRAEGISIPYPHQELHIVRDGKRREQIEIVAAGGPAVLAEEPEVSSDKSADDTTIVPTREPVDVVQVPDDKSAGRRRGRAPAR